jgi:hypothetical protein
VLVIIGFIVVFGSIVVGFIMHGGQLAVLVRVSEFIIIGGATSRIPRRARSSAATLASARTTTQSRTWRIPSRCCSPGRSNDHHLSEILDLDRPTPRAPFRRWRAAIPRECDRMPAHGARCVSM